LTGGQLSIIRSIAHRSTAQPLNRIEVHVRALARTALLVGSVTTFGCSTKQPASTIAAAPVPTSGDVTERRFVDSVLAGMTLEEKAGQLNQLTGIGSANWPRRSSRRIPADQTR
jgi:hypothetical protein